MIAIETEEGRAWAEAKIKQLTGGDPISARFMRQDFFEYNPAFKLMIAGNHKPSLRSVDEAIRRRFHLVPFAVTIPAGERDPDLADKLKAEWPGILQWMIDGCRDWHTNGLCPPKIVTNATADYLESEDTMSAWLTERCQLDAMAWGKSSELFADYRDYAKDAGEDPGTQKRFSQSLVTRGFCSQKRNTGNVFNGLRLTPQMTGEY